MVQLIKISRGKNYHLELAATAEKRESGGVVAPGTSEQTKNCINTASDVTLLLKETLIVWEIIQTPVMSTKFNNSKGMHNIILNLAGLSFCSSLSLVHAFW